MQLAYKWAAVELNFQFPFQARAKKRKKKWNYFHFQFHSQLPTSFSFSFTCLLQMQHASYWMSGAWSEECRVWGGEACGVAPKNITFVLVIAATLFSWVNCDWDHHEAQWQRDTHRRGRVRGNRGSGRAKRVVAWHSGHKARVSFKK